MSQTVAELFDAALALPDRERAALADLLSASLTPPAGRHPAWAAELRRRAAEADSGAVRPIPLEEVRRGVSVQLDSGGPADG